MIYIIYILLYWLVCAAIGFSIRLYNKPHDSFSWKDVLIMVGVAPLMPLIILFLPIIYVSDYYDKKKKEKRNKEREKKETELKEQLGLKPDEEYVSFKRMGGAGVVKCKECGYKENIISFTHGMTSCEIGRQCPHCLSFVTEYNESHEYHTFGKSETDFVCPKCGTVIRKKEESILKDNDKPLLCPNCHSYRLTYFMRYIT